MKKFSPFNPKNSQKRRVLPVFELDPSQREAVLLALGGTSFVLNGPPGTGKSHTVAALLANAVARGKSVLFVAQKPSALQIVYRKLQEANLSEYCLFYEGDRSVFPCWQKALSLKGEEPSGYRQAERSFFRVMAKATAYHAALHAHHGELSLFAAVEEYFSLKDTEELVRVKEEFFSPYRKENKERCESLLFLLASLHQGIALSHGSFSCYGDFSLCREELLSLGVEVTDSLSSAEKLLASFRKSFLRGYAKMLAEEYFPAFSSFSQNSLLERLRFLQRDLFYKAAREVRVRQTRRVLRLKKSRGTAKEYEKLGSLHYQKKITPSALSRFRRLFRLTPCVIASVEQAKKLSRDFDVVLFDESSQILKSDGLLLAKKGDTVVIAGDEKQLPPTSFFTKKEDGEESLLSFALSLGLYRHSLTRHYRSLHESLIAFSNKRFYGGELFVSPSVSRKSGVLLHECKGVYERNGKKINRTEGESLLSRLLHVLNSDSYKGESIGIVTLSLPQKEYVEELLKTCISQNRLSPERVKESKLFVCNLEAVQGEERDIILLSLCFGCDERGKLSLRFGPLNHEGGERRLNVALTRARKRTEVFSSLPEDFLYARSQSEGVKALQEFLCFVKGYLPKEEKQGQTYLSRDLAARLKENGYSVELGLGSEKRYLDLAVRDKSGYRLGILFDRKQNDPEELLSFTETLRRGGWKVLCLYAIDYFLSPERETEKVLSTLEKLGVKRTNTKEKGETAL